MKNIRTGQRGFSIAEVLTVSVICGILLGSMAMIVPLLMHAPLQIQTQVDNVNTAAIALYKIRRDFSQSDTTGVLGCSYAPVPTCQSYTSPTNVTALAVASADNGAGQFQVDPLTGYPDWLKGGVVVYWLVPNANGSAFDIMRAYIPEPGQITTGPGGVPNLSINVAQLALGAAILISPPPVLSNYIKNISVGVTPSTNMVSFTLVAGTTSGSSSSTTTFASNTYARN